ncbi:MAG: alpha/beta hydrolase [Anaerolineae bacterium]|nr:alpha/beta hydrolase [Anaerolineae bacterium]
MRQFFSWKRLFVIILLVAVFLVVGFVVWANDALQPMPEAIAALQSDSQVQVTESNGWYVFTPTTAQPTTGLIFYPGGRVDARAYAPQMHAIANDGYLAVITPMPLNLAIFGVNKAAEVEQAFPNIQHWAVAGHSLGGSMAAQFLSGNTTTQGLALWASYSAVDLSQAAIEAVSIYGTNDGVAAPQSVLDGASKLPADAVFVAIEGGNHSGFGWYGLQPGDNEASITRDEQTAHTVAATVDMLASLNQ